METHSTDGELRVASDGELDAARPSPGKLCRLPGTPGTGEGRVHTPLACSVFWCRERSRSDFLK